MKKLVLLLLIASSVKSSAQTQQASGPVNVRDRNNVVIRDLVISNTGGNGIELWWCTNVLIENCTIKYTGGNGVNSFNSSNVTIRNCTFLENATGVYASTGSGIIVENCKFQNVNGPRPRGQFVQYNYITGGGNRISCNYMESIMGQGDPEDAISTHSSSGVSGSPIMIENNYIKGGGPSSSGGGIVIGDGGGNYITARSNVLIDPGQYGMAIVSGSNNELSNNKVYGKKQSFSNAGIIIWEYDGSVPCGSGNKVLNNKVMFTKYDGYSSSFWTDNNCSNPTISGNQWASTEVSGTMPPPSCAGLTSGGGSSTPTAPAPAAACPAGSLLVETYANIQGKTVPDLTNSSAYPNSPNSNLTLTTFSYGQSGDYYGRRTRGYVCAPETGNYAFYLACDDAGELWLSTDANPANKRKIAYLTSWVPPGVYNQTATQKSAPISLTKGVKYYIEVVHKAGTGNDHMSVGWTLPSGTFEGPIPASRITGSVSGTSPSTPAPTAACTAGSLLVETYANIQGKTVPDLTNSGAYPNSPSSSLSMTSFEYGVGGEYFGRRTRGYLCPPETGNYTFYFACDDAGELWLSTDANPSTKRKIAYLTSWVPPRVYNQYSTQKSAAISLTKGVKYYIEVVHKAGTGNDHMSVAWTLPSGTTETPIPASRITGTVSSTSSSSTTSGSCTTGGTLWVETYVNVQGKTIADLWASSIFPNSPSSTLSLSKLEYGVSGDYYGRRVRGYICAPQSGGYTFVFACDDAGELWLSTDDNPANKKKIAYLDSWVPPKVYNQVGSQKSAVIQLTQGKRYYVEVIHKAGTGNDHMSVGWTLPNGVFESTIDDIAPYNTAIGVNAATSQSSSVLQVTSESAANSPAELKAGLSVKATPNPSQSSFNIQIQSGKEAPTFIRVTDMMGRLIEQRKDIQNAKTIQIGQNWAKGIYILELSQGDQRRILKLMKE